MNAHQEKKLKMYMTVRDYLLQNASMTSELPGFQEFFTAVQNGINKIQVLQEQKEVKITGFSAVKSDLRETLVRQAIDISRKLVAYATIANNMQLQKETKYTESDLKRSGDTILKDQAQVIYSKAMANLPALIPFGVSDTLLANLLDAINNFNASIPKVRLGVTEKKQTNTQLEQNFEQVDLNVKKIDLLIETLRNSKENFYSGYKSSRKIVDTGIKYVALRGSVLDKNSSNPIKGVHFNFSLLNGVAFANPEAFVPFEKTSAVKGNFIVKSMPEGKYAVKISKPGYKEQYMNISVSEKERFMLKVLLEKE